MRGFRWARSLLNMESRAPKRGVWLMRGAQPATSAGARLFAGSPIPALFTALQEEVKKSILSLLNFSLLRDERFQNCPSLLGKSSRIFHVIALVNSLP